MAGVRIGGVASIPVVPGIPYTVQSLSDFQYLAQGLVEVTDKTVNVLDEANNAMLSPNQLWIAVDANFPNPPDDGTIQVVSSAAVGGTPSQFNIAEEFPFPDARNGYRLHPTWHPNNDTVIYVHSLDGFQGDIVTSDRTNPGVETVIYSNPDTSGATGWGVYRPQFNRDGTKVAWLRNKNAAPADGNNGLYVADADGSSLTQIDDMGGGASSGYLFQGSQFQWGPGNTIVYVRYVNNTATGSQIYLINSDGTGMTQLSTDGDTSAHPCRISNRCFSPGDDFIIGTAQTSKSFVNSWDLWRWELDGSGGTWLDLGVHGPDGGTYFRCAYVHNNRIHMVESKSGGKIISCAMDGTDITTDVDLGVNMDGDQFYDGTGIEWI